MADLATVCNTDVRAQQNLKARGLSPFQSHFQKLGHKVVVPRLVVAKWLAGELIAPPPTPKNSNKPLRLPNRKPVDLIGLRREGADPSKHTDEELMDMEDRLWLLEATDELRQFFPWLEQIAP